MSLNRIAILILFSCTTFLYFQLREQRKRTYVLMSWSIKDKATIQNITEELNKEKTVNLQMQDVQDKLQDEINNLQEDLAELRH